MICRFQPATLILVFIFLASFISTAFLLDEKSGSLRVSMAFIRMQAVPKTLGLV
jgi:hypothetical protein